ncbi:MAG: type III pantothenate kinase [Oscillospiraceae bacterium]
MILAIDVGNSHIVIGCIDGLEIKNISRMATNTLRTENEYAIKIRQLLEFDGFDHMAFEGVIISSVVPPLTGTLKSAVKMLTGHNALIVGSGIKTGLNILIDNPAQLGSDLAAGGVAAIQSYKLPVIVFDMGTATTISVIDEKSNFLGGAIVPGLSLSLSALSSGTSQLPKIPIEAPRHCVGTNTIDCMKSGGVLGTAAMMDGMIDRIEEELGKKASVVATGGISRFVVPHCKRKVIHDEDLLLRGLALIYAKNKK